MAERVGTGELAKRLGISRQRISDLAKEKKLTRESDGLWNVSRVRQELARNLDPQQQKRARVDVQPTPLPAHAPMPPAVEASGDGLGLTGSTHEMFNRARAAKEIAIAKERQLDLRRRQGELLEASEVEQVWTEALTSFKNRLLSLPDKLAPRMAACSNVLECRAMIDQEVRKVLSALSESKADAA